MNDPTLKHHHHLITGEIVFTGNNDEVNTIELTEYLSILKSVFLPVYLAKLSKFFS